MSWARVSWKSADDSARISAGNGIQKFYHARPPSSRRSTAFCTSPRAPLGISSRKWTRRGCLKRAKRLRRASAPSPSGPRDDSRRGPPPAGRVHVLSRTGREVAVSTEGASFRCGLGPVPSSSTAGSTRESWRALYRRRRRVPGREGSSSPDVRSTWMMGKSAVVVPASRPSRTRRPVTPTPAFQPRSPPASNRHFGRRDLGGRADASRNDGGREEIDQPNHLRLVNGAATGEKRCEEERRHQRGFPASDHAYSSRRGGH